MCRKCCPILQISYMYEIQIFILWRLLFSHLFELITMLILYVQYMHKPSLYVIVLFTPCSHVDALRLLLS